MVEGGGNITILAVIVPFVVAVVVVAAVVVTGLLETAVAVEDVVVLIAVERAGAGAVVDTAVKCSCLVSPML